MFRIKLLLCYSLIDTNTIPFYFSLSQIGRVESHTRRFGLTVSFRRFPSSFYESYTPGHLLDLRSHLVAWEIIYFYFADASARTSSDTASTWCVCGTQKVWGNLLRISSVLPTSLHIRRALFSLFVHFFSSSVTALKHNLSFSILAFFLLDL